LYWSLFVNNDWKILGEDNSHWEKLYLSVWGAYPGEWFWGAKNRLKNGTFDFKLCFIRKKLAEKGVLFSPVKPKIYRFYSSSTKKSNNIYSKNLGSFYSDSKISYSNSSGCGIGGRKLVFTPNLSRNYSNNNNNNNVITYERRKRRRTQENSRENYENENRENGGPEIDNRENENPEFENREIGSRGNGGRETEMETRTPAEEGELERFLRQQREYFEQIDKEVISVCSPPSSDT